MINKNPHASPFWQMIPSAWRHLTGDEERTHIKPSSSRSEEVTSTELIHTVHTCPMCQHLPPRLTFTRNSFIGGGNRRPRIWVTMGPSTPGTIIVSPSFKRPLISITSIVVPIPGRALTWETLVYKGSQRDATLCWLNLTAEDIHTQELNC